jgi:hypothetical protein
MPIVSDVNALPDIAAGCGIVVKQRNKEVLKAAIEKALQMSTTAMAQKAVGTYQKGIYDAEEEGSVVRIIL